MMGGKTKRERLERGGGKEKKNPGQAGWIAGMCRTRII
jgi:hypothetical protein